MCVCMYVYFFAACVYVHVLVSFMFCSDLVFLCLSCLCSFCSVHVMLLRHVAYQSLFVCVFVCVPRLLCVCVSGLNPAIHPCGAQY